MNPASEHRQVIERWMLAIRSVGGLERLDDVHLDQIRSEWGSKDRWIDGGLEALRTAVELRSAHNLDVTIVPAFSLNAPPRYPFKDRFDFEAALDWSPPSLYLFNPGDEPWLKPEYARIEPLDTNVVFGSSEGVSAYFAEFQSQATGKFAGPSTYDAEGGRHGSFLGRGSMVNAAGMKLLIARLPELGTSESPKSRFFNTG